MHLFDWIYSNNPSIATPTVGNYMILIFAGNLSVFSTDLAAFCYCVLFCFLAVLASCFTSCRLLKPHTEGRITHFFLWCLMFLDLLMICISVTLPPNEQGSVFQTGSWDTAIRVKYIFLKFEYPIKETLNHLFFFQSIIWHILIQAAALSIQCFDRSDPRVSTQISQKTRDVPLFDHVWKSHQISPLVLQRSTVAEAGIEAVPLQGHSTTPTSFFFLWQAPATPDTFFSKQWEILPAAVSSTAYPRCTPKEV